VGRPGVRARRVLAKDGNVWVEYLVLADAVHTDNLRLVITKVLQVADDLGLMLATVHGGSTPITPEPSPAEG
jgi:hypothetical protein